MGSILDMAKRDMDRIVNNTDGWAETIEFITSDDLTTVTIAGIHTKVHLNIDEFGKVISTKKAHITINEKTLTDLNYPVRNTKGEVNLRNHKVNVKDSTGNIKNYIVEVNIPDEMLGNITLILTDYKNA